MVLAIYFKQMALYFAIPFGVFALARIYIKAREKYEEEGFSYQLIYISRRILRLLFVFIMMNTLLLLPFI